MGPVTLVVNNAGNAGPSGSWDMDKPFWETDPTAWDRYFHTNLTGVMNCCYAALPGMVAQNKGRLVTIVSDAGRVGDMRLAVYSAAKAGAAGFMRSLARETGRYGITANSISLSTQEPQQMDEAAREAFMASDRVKAQLKNYIIRRFGRPDDVAGMALFLCSEAASWITGQTYPVNGGYSVTQ
jgi:3-oxoacyl-[acyl-carrier protein] reductase